MTQTSLPAWHRMKTDETRAVESALRAQFAEADAYRYNSASIRVRVVDSRFKGKSTEKRDAMVERVFSQLPQSTQADIINLLTLYPDETNDSLSKSLANEEFEHHTKSSL